MNHKISITEKLDRIRKGYTISPVMSDHLIRRLADTKVLGTTEPKNTRFYGEEDLLFSGNSQYCIPPGLPKDPGFGETVDLHEIHNLFITSMSF